MIAMEQQKKDLQEKIETEVNRLSGSISNDVVVARAQVGSLAASLAQAEKQAGTQNLVRVNLRALQSNAQSTRTMYEAFVTRLRETQDQDVIQNPDARVISTAPVPASPSSPKRMLILAASIPAGLMLGLLAALLAERLSGPVPARVAPAVAFRPVPQPVMRVPPVVAALEGASDPRAVNAVLDWPASPFAQGTRSLLQQLRGAARKPGAVVVSVAGLDSGTAKTAVAVSLARAAAQARLRVAVIDADLNRPLAARAMGIAPQRAGLTELLMGTLPIAHAFGRDPRANVSVISPAQATREPARVLASAKMAELMGYLRRNCDVVIFHAPSLFAASEIDALATLSDAVLVVARDETAMRNAAALESFAAAHAVKTGVVLAR
jgi:Mrp family chromosome partitioning ATPase